jgi:predicted outer membrane protein
MSSSVLLAQDPPNQPTKTPHPSVTQEPQSDTAGSDKKQRQGREIDAILATWLQVDNENVIALSRLAVERATDPDVKKFATRTIEGHGKLAQKLRQVARAPGQEHGEIDAEQRKSDREDEPTPATHDAKGEYPPGTRDKQVSDARSDRFDGTFHVRLVRDLGRKCLASATAMLEHKQGAEFDRCYMTMQLGAHIKALDTLEVFQSYATESLRPTLAEALKTVQAHLQDVKDLQKRTEVSLVDHPRK